MRPEDALLTSALSQLDEATCSVGDAERCVDDHQEKCDHCGQTIGDGPRYIEFWTDELAERKKRLAGAQSAVELVRRTWPDAKDLREKPE
jgi:hypothetical protein